MFKPLEIFFIRDPKVRTGQKTPEDLKARDWDRMEECSSRIRIRPEDDDQRDFHPYEDPIRSALAAEELLTSLQDHLLHGVRKM
jgi:hypothetical protein